VLKGRGQMVMKRLWLRVLWRVCYCYGHMVVREVCCCCECGTACWYNCTCF